MPLSRRRPSPREVWAVLASALACFTIFAVQHFATSPFAWVRLQQWLAHALGG